MTDSNVTNMVEWSPNFHSPSRRYKVFVIHDVESPLDDDYAVTLAGPAWFGKTSAQSSAHYMVGPQSIIQMVLESNASWAVGPRANGITTSAEQTGYARFSRAEWTTADGVKQVKNMARLFVDYAQRRGLAMRKVTDAELRAYYNGQDIPGGYVHHSDITRVIGGTTHTDTGSNWPNDLFQNEVDNLVKPTPVPTPVPPAPEPDQDLLEFIMSLPGAPSTYGQVVDDIVNQLVKVLAVDPKSVERSIAIANNRLNHAQNADGSKPVK